MVSHVLNAFLCPGCPDIGEHIVRLYRLKFYPRVAFVLALRAKQKLPFCLQNPPTDAQCAPRGMFHHFMTILSWLSEIFKQVYGCPTWHRQKSCLILQYIGFSQSSQLLELKNWAFGLWSTSLSCILIPWNKNEKLKLTVIFPEVRNRKETESGLRFSLSSKHMNMVRYTAWAALTKALIA